MWFAINALSQNVENIGPLSDDTLNVTVTDSVIPGKIEIGDEEMGVFSSRLDSFNNSWEVQNAFRYDSAEVQLRDNYPKNIPDSVYIQRLARTKQVIDLSYNPAVLSFIKMYTERKRDQVERMLGLSDYYFPKFEEVLDKYNLPLELKYLPIIESALDPRAVSRVGAMGMWQFMFGTAKLLNMEITSFIDERRDPVKSTESAAIYLKRLFDIYKDWHLAIAAYNCGPGNVDRAIRRSGGKTNYWDIYYWLPRETRGYVPLFIAATYVMNYYNEHNLIPRVPAMPVNNDTIMVRKYLHFDQVSAVLGLDNEYIRALNPMYRRSVVPATADKPYPLVIPQGKINEFIDKDTSIFAWERSKYFPDNSLAAPRDKNADYFVPDDVKGKSKISYKVKSGDTVGGIAARYKVRTSDLVYWNNIKKNRIKAGQYLAIYVPEREKAKQEKVAAKSEETKQAGVAEPKVSTVVSTENQGEFEYYTVQKGDNIWLIAQKFDGVSSDDIIRLNNIRNTRGLDVGQKLKIRRKS